MRPLAERVKAVARRSPDSPAVHDERGWTSYGVLDSLSNQVARALLAHGVKPGDRVGVWLDKSVWAVAAFQGTLRVGAAYVPLDPASPPSRILGIVDACALAAVVTEGARVGRVGARAVPLSAVMEQSGGPVPEVPRQPDDLAYILYTSGSTGTPKGVCLTERNAAAFVDWAVGALAARESDVFSNHAPFHFDLSVLDLYAAFAVGAGVCLVPDGIAYAPARLVAFLAERQVTVWYSVPSALVLMLERGSLLERSLPALRTVCFAGEPFPTKHLRRLVEAWPHVAFWNLYGPTETNVCTAYAVTELAADRTEPVPIGVAVSGDTVWAVGEDGQPVADGELGELWVDGPTVHAGYWGQPPHTGPYATGDLVRRQADGAYVYAGRRDHMVKVRGHRVELGDIEAALLELDGLDEVAVVVQGTGLDARLVAFAAATTGESLGLLAVKRHCAERLPRYMIVDEVRWLEGLPRTRNGKIDRRALLQRAHQPRGGDRDP